MAENCIFCFKKIEEEEEEEDDDDDDDDDNDVLSGSHLIVLSTYWMGQIVKQFHFSVTAYILGFRVKY